MRFRSVDLLNLAFIHRSHPGEDGNPAPHNERLEFLGDSVLGLVVSAHLYLDHPDKPEGELSRLKSYIVSEESLAGAAVRLGIPGLLLLGKGEECSGGREKRAILADAFEAVVGALFLDGGLEPARAFILEHLGPEIASALCGSNRRDWKTLLQERCQKELKTCPRYVVEGKSGPDHMRIYHMAVRVGEQQFGPADGRNKKEAEQKAAALAWKALFPGQDH